MKYTYNGFCADSGNREMTSRRASTGVLHTRPPANALPDPSQLPAFVVLHLLATVTLVSLAFYLTASSSPPSPRSAGGQSQVTVRAIQLRCIYLRIVGPPHGNLPGPETHQTSTQLTARPKHVHYSTDSSRVNPSTEVTKLEVCPMVCCQSFSHYLRTRNPTGGATPSMSL